MTSAHISTTLLPDRKVVDLWITDGRFSFDPIDGAETVHTGGYAISGLVDAHAHLTLASPLADGSDEEIAEASARRHVEAGVLAVREPGSPDRASRDVSGPGLPTIITAGRFLAPPGGYFPGMAREVTDDRLPDAAREELGHSSAWVKIIGDFFDDAGRFSTNYTTEALRETASRVHDSGGRITIHAMIPDTVQQAIDAGFDGIEHGSVVEAGQVEAMAAAGVAWTPTALIDDVLRDNAVEMVGAGAPWLLEGLASHGAAIRRAHELGVRILAGTDAGMTPHGVVAKEIRLLHALGLSAEAALAAGAWDARSYLGLPGVEEGAPADLVVFPDDPTGDLAVLDHPSLVIVGGRRIESLL